MNADKTNTTWRFVSLLLIAGFAFGGAISPQAYIEHVKYLASPELKGRATGSPELEKAAAYIEAQFKAAGLKSSEQAFPVTINAHLGTKNTLRWNAKDETEFQPFSFS